MRTAPAVEGGLIGEGSRCAGCRLAPKSPARRHRSTTTTRCPGTTCGSPSRWRCAKRGGCGVGLAARGSAHAGCCDQRQAAGAFSGALKRDGADDVLEPPHGRQFLGRAPRDEPGPVAATPEGERQRLRPSPGSRASRASGAHESQGPLTKQEQLASRTCSIAVLKLMFAAMTRASERWRAIYITDFECRQIVAFSKISRPKIESTPTVPTPRQPQVPRAVIPFSG